MNPILFTPLLLVPAIVMWVRSHILFRTTMKEVCTSQYGSRMHAYKAWRAYCRLTTTVLLVCAAVCCATLWIMSR